MNNFFGKIDAQYIGFVDNGHYSKNRVFFFRDCYTYEQFEEINRSMRGDIRVLEWDSLENLVVIESYNKNINKITTIKFRKDAK